MKLNRRPDHSGPFRQEFERNKRKILMTQDTCAICGRPVDKTIKAPDPMSPSIDHIIPIAKGGHPSDIDNLQLTHRMCNRWKGVSVLPERTEPVKQPLFQTMNWKDF